jgi:hypothetical protein
MPEWRHSLDKKPKLFMLKTTNLELQSLNHIIVKRKKEFDGEINSPIILLTQLLVVE